MNRLVGFAAMAVSCLMLLSCATQYVPSGLVVSEETLFRALTIDNARAIGLDGEIGTVEVDKTANLLLLRADPLKSVEAYDSIETVFLHGRPIPRETLSARAVKEGQSYNLLSRRK